MFFSAFVGPDTGTAAWRAAVTAHARWLGCGARLRAGHAALDQAYTVSWLDGTVAPPGSTNAVRVTRNGPASALEISVPPATPQQCYSVAAFSGRVFTDDLRFCAALTGAALDPAGVYSLLLYGAVPPPFTLLRGVERLAGGHTFTVDARGRVSGTRQFAPDRAPTTDVALAERRVAGVLDPLIGELPPGALLFFSGGVDSSLLAARAAALGRGDLQLVNYAFGPDDPEAAHALRVAAHLRLACERVAYDPRGVEQVLGRLARDYAFPFGDLSTIPTNLLVHAALAERRPLAAVEGTGADGAFGLSATYGRWRAVFAMPDALRAAAGAAYGWLRLWRRSSFLERALRFARKSTRLTIGPAVMAQHSLDSIAFDVPADVRAEIPELVRRQLEVLGETATPQERLSLLDLAWVCAGRMAPKTFDPLRARGVMALYPYLEPALVQASTSVSWGVKSAGGDAKALLKRMLAHQLPPALVYRQKSGFTPPYRATFTAAPLQAHLHDVVLAPGNPLLEWCDAAVVRDLVTRAARREPLSYGALDFLWALTFASGWLHQLPRERAA